MGRIGAILILFLAGMAAAAGSQAFTLRDLPASASGEREARTPPGAPAWLAQTDGGREAPKSKGKALMYSLLLPGLGHYYAGDVRGARTFFAVEASVWTAFVVFEVQGRLREEGYEDFAQAFAGIAGNNHSDDYYAVISEYDSWTDYERAVKTEGRFALYPEGDAAMLEAYFIENRVSDFEPWEWESSDVRRDYRSIRSASKRSYRRAVYSVAVAAVNRVASAFFAIKATNDANDRMEERRLGYRLEIGAPVVHPDEGLQTGLTFVATF